MSEIKYFSGTEEDVLEIVKLTNAFIKAVCEIKPKRTNIAPAIGKLRNHIEKSRICSLEEYQDDYERLRFGLPNCESESSTE